MFRFTAGLAALALAAWATPAAAEPEVPSAPLAAPTAEAPEGTPITTGTSYTIPSAVYGTDRTINIQPWPAYGDPETAPNVLFVIDGGLTQDFGHIAGLAQLAAISWTIEPLIVVGIETTDRQSELTPVAENPNYPRGFPTAGEAAKFRQFIETEVMPFVAARYPETGRRAVMGESLAGLFIVDTFLKDPDLFDDYIAVSPSLWWDDHVLGRRAPEHLAEQGTSDRRLYLTIGDEGGTMQTGMDELLVALDAGAPEGLSWVYRDRTETDTHATIYHGAALDALRWLYSTPPYDYGEQPWYMIEGGVPPEPQ